MRTHYLARSERYNARAVLERIHLMPTQVTLIPGDGIGPSIADATVRVLEAAGADIQWDTQVAGQAGVARWHDPMPEQTLDSIKRTRLALKGPLETPVGGGFRSVNVALRKTFDLYANVRPAHSIIRSQRHYDNLDLVLVRENTEGLYIGLEHYVSIGNDPKAAAESIAVITRYGWRTGGKRSRSSTRRTSSSSRRGSFSTSGARSRRSTRGASSSRTRSSTRWR